MMREARDATFETSDGAAIAFALHGLPRAHLTPIECPDRISSHLLAVLRRS
jgi:hypothetical protein